MGRPPIQRADGFEWLAITLNATPLREKAGPSATPKNYCSTFGRLGEML